MPPERFPVDPETNWAVWGQPGAVRELKRAAATSPSHAYLFVGATGTGRKVAAVEFAKALCCPQPTSPGVPCRDCAVCRRIERGTFPDVSLVNLATQAERDRDRTKNQSLNIATVREIGNAVAYRPAEAPWRIVIVDDAETMQETAQEAFLKTLEEPPSYTVIVLIATTADRVLDTIRSRCTEIRFGRSPGTAIAAALAAHGVDEDVASEIERHADGAAGWAFAATRDPKLLESRIERESAAIGMIGADRYGRMVRAVALADEWSANRAAVVGQLHALAATWRTLLLRHMDVGSQVGNIGFDVDQFSVRQIVRALKSVESCLQNLESNVRPRLAMESMVAAWPDIERATHT